MRDIRAPNGPTRGSTSLITATLHVSLTTWSTWKLAGDYSCLNATGQCSFLFDFFAQVLPTKVQQLPWLIIGWCQQTSPRS